jgi:hypothetical protein
VESLKKITLFLIISCLFSRLEAQTVSGKKEMIKTSYFNRIYGSLHQSPSRTSQSLTAIACNHPLRVMRLIESPTKKTEVFADGWLLVSSGPYEGYIHQDFVSDQKPNCFADRYPRFLNALELEVTDQFYWGKLYDQYDRGRTKTP